MAKYICTECSGSEWEPIVRNIVHDDSETTLYQCKKCKRVVAYKESYMGFADEDVRL